MPNLLSLKGARSGRSSGRNQRGRGGHSSASASGPSADAAVQGTDTDASVSRLSAVELGYLDDPFAKYFVAQGPPGHAIRRLPIINRGTYTRAKAIDRLISLFLVEGAGEERQIVSLGAGSDTRCFRYFSQPGVKGLIWHELDFPVTSSRKLRTVQANPPLRSIIANPEDAAGGMWSSQNLPNGCQYWCHGLDLRDFSKADKPTLKGIKPHIPTLLVSECCLCYLEHPEAKEVIKHFADKIPNLSIVIYETVKPDDAFGKQLVSNLANRRIRMPTLDVYKTTADQERRLKDAGFDNVRNMTVDNVWTTWIPTEEKERLDELEGLDEVEEWNLLAGHYIVAWGWRGRGFEGWKSL